MTRRQTADATKKVLVHVRLTPEERDELHEMARENLRPAAHEIRLAIRDRVAAHNAEKRAA